MTKESREGTAVFNPNKGSQRDFHVLGGKIVRLMMGAELEQAVPFLSFMGRGRGASLAGFC